MTPERLSSSSKAVWVGLLALGLSTPSGTALADDATRIVFASGPDGSGTIQQLIEGFNAKHTGKFHVTWKEMDRDNNTHHQQLVDALKKQTDAPHVFASDVIWTAELARKGWVEDLTPHFYKAYDRATFVKPALDSATHRLRIWGIPWYTDASVLFYRKDLLSKSGFDAPPKTWDELGSMAKKVMKDSGVENGFIFQGAQYEGGSVNAAEFVWGAGGGIMRGRLAIVGPLNPTVVETDAVIIDSPDAAKGLDSARRFITDGISPEAVTTYREQEALDAFKNGQAVFLRSWPYVQRVLQDAGWTSAKMGVSLLPAASTDNQGYSCLGGWNLMVNARSNIKERAAALAFVAYLADPAQQKTQATNAGNLPVVERLYQDPEILSKVPVAALFKDTVSSRLRVRPQTPYYDKLSTKIADIFQQVLKGELTGEKAVKILDKDLRAIVTRNL